MGMLEGKVAVITGSGRGIGAAAAKLFAAEGAAVVVSDLDPTAAEETAGAIRQAGGKAIVLAGFSTLKRVVKGHCSCRPWRESIHTKPEKVKGKCTGDVTDPAFPSRLLKATLDAFGGIDIIVNNAGYAWDTVIQI